MKNKIVLGLLLFLLYSLPTMAQLRNIEKENFVVGKSRIIDTDILNSKSSDSKLNISHLIASSRKNQMKEDTLYFADIDFKNMWMIGRGDTLTKEEALRRPIYYRFTMKNSKGHWQHIEAMSKNNYTTYNGSCMYDGVFIGEVDEKLKSSLNETTQWFEISDLDGDELLEERSYDAEGNLLLTCLFHKHNDGRVIACYNDSNGFPVDFMPDDNYTYGHVYALTLDEEGRSTVVEYLDGAGFDRPGAMGVYQRRFIRDEEGRRVEKTYHNGVGHLMNNKYGYAKETTEYSSDRKYQVTKHFDMHNNLVKSTEPWGLGFMIQETEYDEQGEIKSWRYFTIKDGEKINDEVDGVHCYVIDSFDHIEGSSVNRKYDKNLNEIKN